MTRTKRGGVGLIGSTRFRYFTTGRPIINELALVCLITKEGLLCSASSMWGNQLC
jgi:hypothetical protein